ncbi:MAG: bifunctional metallophosphatase/5'-nucleotidase [Muribaculaceae bacterium]|nr:bifunctional metallophosphatase/5'-nucleotidase [Muribaculaceae bacterium]
MLKNAIGKISLAAAMLVMAVAGLRASAEKLVLLHTNDTHSLIEPDAKGRGGVIQRKAIFDSVRRADRNVMLIDAGDAVQGTLYFKFFKGDVEYPVMNMLEYDIRILGNHEFDNGLEEMARYWKGDKSHRLSTNYDFTGTPAEGIFDPWYVKKIGGKTVGFMGINVDPESLIAKAHYEGMKFRDVLRTANETAAFLKEKKHCDLVVAVTHIGYEKENDKTTDVELARGSRDIDIIIGGHSHTLVNPSNPGEFPYLIPNAEGRDVLVAQTGKSGLYVGRIEIDLDRYGKGKSPDGSAIDYSLIPVTDRFPAEKRDRRLEAFVDSFRQRVDSVNARKIAWNAREMKNYHRTGAFPNWTADFGKWYGSLVADSLRAAGHDVGPLDFSIMNVGGIRSSWAEGPVTEGQVLSTFPFSNHMVLMRLKGADLVETMRMAARKGGEAISDDLRVITDGEGDVMHVLLHGEEVDPEREYLMMTIDYLAWGNDDMVPLANGEWVWREETEMAAPMMRYINHLTSLGLPVMSDPNPRFVKRVDLNSETDEDDDEEDDD